MATMAYDKVVLGMGNEVSYDWKKPEWIALV